MVYALKNEKQSPERERGWRPMGERESTLADIRKKKGNLGNTAWKKGKREKSTGKRAKEGGGESLYV